MMTAYAVVVAVYGAIAFTFAGFLVRARLGGNQTLRAHNIIAAAVVWPVCVTLAAWGVFKVWRSAREIR